MNAEQVCQWIIVAFSALSFFLILKIDVEGRPAKEPSGFAGIIGTFIVFTIQAVVLYFAGALDALL